MIPAASPQTHDREVDAVVRAEDWELRGSDGRGRGFHELTSALLGVSMDRRHKLDFLLCSVWGYCIARQTGLLTPLFYIAGGRPKKAWRDRGLKSSRRSRKTERISEKTRRTNGDASVY